MKENSFFDSSRIGQWRAALSALLVLLAGVSIIYGHTVLGMLDIWLRSETFTHCFLVLPISLWLIWRKKEALLELSPRPNFWLLAPATFLAIFWALGEITTTNSIAQFSYVLLMQVFVVGVIGNSAAKLITFPLVFLIFMVPAGEFLLPVLMDWTANFTVAALRITGIPVYRDGLQFVIPSGSWSVVEACSGVRYLMASVTVGTLFAYLNYSSYKKRAIFIGFSIVVPIIANWMRAYLIVLLGHLSGNTIAVGFDHIIYGWVFFGVVIALMFMLGIRWAEPMEASSGTSGKNVYSFEAQSKNYYFLTFLIAALAVSGMSAMLVQRFNGNRLGATVSLELPEKLNKNWALLTGNEKVWHPEFKLPSATVNSIYTDGSNQVGVYIGYYREQVPGKKLISSENVLVGSEDRKWMRVGQNSATVPTSEVPVPVKVTSLRNLNNIANSNNSSMVVLQYYWVNGYLTTNDYLAKVYGAVSKIFRNSDDSAVIIFYAVGSSNETLSRSLEEFLRDNYSYIDLILKGAQTSAIGTFSKNLEVNKG